MSLLGLAIRLATEKHEGQFDKANEPYILHPLRVMLAQTRQAERIVGVLHDVVEKSDVTLDDLVEMGFPAEIVSAVDAMTRRENEDYFDFVRRSGANQLAKPVKLADARQFARGRRTRLAGRCGQVRTGARNPRAKIDLKFDVKIWPPSRAATRPVMTNSSVCSLQ